MSTDLKELLKAAKRTVTLINLGQKIVKNKSIRGCLILYRDDMERIVSNMQRKRIVSQSDEMIVTEFLTGNIQAALSILCSDGSFGCLLNR